MDFEMTELSEITILQEGLVKVTNQRTVIGTISYSISDIKAVRVTSRSKDIKPLWLTIPGILLIAWSLIDQTAQFMELFNIGIALIATGVAVVLIAKPTYAIQIGSAAGEHSILRSRDPNFIQRIVDAMNHAIAPGARKLDRSPAQVSARM
jgi:hypothetical protein